MIGLSANDIASHDKWIKDITEVSGNSVNFVSRDLLLTQRLASLVAQHLTPFPIFVAAHHWRQEPRGRHHLRHVGRFVTPALLIL